jgi:hypothetical protein
MIGGQAFPENRRFGAIGGIGHPWKSGAKTREDYRWSAGVLDIPAPVAHVIHMSDKRTKRNWRAFLTPEEKKQLAAIERKIEALEAKLMLAKAKRNRVQNRSTVRAGK